MKTTLDHLFRVDPPWIDVGIGEPERKKWIPSHFYSRAGIDICVRRLRGQKMRTTPALMDEFAAALQFFEGFGENWCALVECLSYLDEWLPADAYVLVIEGAEALLHDEPPEQMAALLKTLNDAGEWWSKPVVDNDRFNRKGIPFHALLNLREPESTAAARICQIAAAASVPFRRQQTI